MKLLQPVALLLSSSLTLAACSDGFSARGANRAGAGGSAQGGSSTGQMNGGQAGSAGAGTEGGAGGAASGGEGGTESGGEGGEGGTASGGEGGTESGGEGGMESGGEGGTESGGEGGEGGAPPVTECTPEEEEPCWQLEDGTDLPEPMPEEEVGSCRIGTRYCDSAGFWGDCLGAVGPEAADSCDVAGDDADCNGKKNEDCPCVDGEVRGCGTDTGTCVEGEQTCEDEVWGDCVGEVVAQSLDSCVEDGNDDNCNGTSNDDCPCIGNESEACNECGTHQCTPASRQWGACTPADTTRACGCGTETCNSSGNWSSCAPAPAYCVDSTDRWTCNSQGVVSVDTCQFACVGTSCGGVCVPGSKRCSNNGVQTCGDNGQWSSSVLCNNGFNCVAGACSATECRPEFDRVCNGVCITGCCTAAQCPVGPNATSSCNGAHQCSYACGSNRANCDGDWSDGCEVDLRLGTDEGTTTSHCGVCNNTCQFVNTGDNGFYPVDDSICQQGECYARWFSYSATRPIKPPHATLYYYDGGPGGYYNCDSGYWDCDFEVLNGCETATANLEQGHSCYSVDVYLREY